MKCSGCQCKHWQNQGKLLELKHAHDKRAQMQVDIFLFPIMRMYVDIASQSMIALS